MRRPSPGLVPGFDNDNATGVAVDSTFLPVLIGGSTTSEGNPGFETFTTTLENAANAYSPPAQATGTGYIIDGNLLNLSIGDTSVADSANGATMVFHGLPQRRVGARRSAFQLEFERRERPRPIWITMGPAVRHGHDPRRSSHFHDDFQCPLFRKPFTRAIGRFR